MLLQFTINRLQILTFFFNKKVKFYTNMSLLFEILNQKSLYLKILGNKGILTFLKIFHIKFSKFRK